jgi:hypothetical protein
MGMVLLTVGERMLIVLGMGTMEGMVGFCGG